MGESRQELLAWLNNLLQLNVTKVEQCGTGAALCQIFDSIFFDVPMAKVKFNVNSEYAYIQNFKVLQNAFTRHQIDRSIPIESLVKCKMQDNLEFLQWSKRYWDQYFPGLEYDPVARRQGAGTSMSASTSAPPARAAPRTSTTQHSAPPARRPMASSNSAAPRVASARTGSAGGGAQVQALQTANAELKESFAGLERERDFYFNKLREIEVLLQGEVEAKPELETENDGIIGKVQAILYSTEEGFEIPDVGEGEGDGEAAGNDGHAVAAEEETF